MHIMSGLTESIRMLSSFILLLNESAFVYTIHINLQ